MTKIEQTSKCADCGAPIDDEANAPDMHRPCIVCGSTKRVHSVSIMETLVARNGYCLKAKRPDQRKPYVEDLSMPDYSLSLGKHVHRQRVIDRDTDHYFEKITDCETGEVIHHCEEPLSQHQGYGDAKRKNNQGK
jgi:hypothetical protein